MVTHAEQFERCMVSVSRLRARKSDFPVNDWILDSGAFSEVTKHGGYREEPRVYASQVNRWQRCGNMLAAVSQDYMCEPPALRATGLSISEHQRLTIERYKVLRSLCPDTYIMPVLQGYEPSSYVDHIRQYGELLPGNAWVGVGSVCKRNAAVGSIEDVLLAIRQERPDLRLHGFGIKVISLGSPFVRHTLYSADSMAWSFAARYEGRDANSAQEAHNYVATVARQAK